LTVFWWQISKNHFKMFTLHNYTNRWRAFWLSCFWWYSMVCQHISVLYREIWFLYAVEPVCLKIYWCSIAFKLNLTCLSKVISNYSLVKSAYVELSVSCQFPIHDGKRFNRRVICRRSNTGWRCSSFSRTAWGPEFLKCCSIGIGHLARGWE